MAAAGRFLIGADHPSLPGHFPGQPVVPGVVLLEAMIALVLAQLPGRRLAGLRLVKFLRAVGPDQSIEVSYEAGAADAVTVVGALDDAPVVRAVARLRPAG